MIASVNRFLEGEESPKDFLKRQNIRTRIITTIARKLDTTARTIHFQHLHYPDLNSEIAGVVNDITMVLVHQLGTTNTYEIEGYIRSEVWNDLANGRMVGERSREWARWIVKTYRQYLAKDPALMAELDRRNQVPF